MLARISDALTRDGDGALSAVLFIDLDGFKDVDDSLGHEAGDTVLRTAAERLQRAVRPDDLVARLGGGEVVPLLFGPTANGVLDQVSERLHATLVAPTRIGGTVVNVSASSGIAPVGEGDKRDATAILHDADLAMYAAKAAGPGESRHATQLPAATGELLDVN
ncbi:PAS domain S-box/diguanylate cyclase (GGDEF) domain-containing protein (fragment) [uncultured Mycobacterium sp.]|uniref:PAS domain S-box/diguanylate cyclase (GGDEF) domain-containing protein n=1 Tax=uncultured Mycobacterium sp. TaxID=171292 RepID=A0A1Y5P405_9MYCO